MGWFSRKSGKSDAERTLESLEEGPPPKVTPADPAPGSPGEAIYADTELFLTLRETPATRTPGTRLAVRNEGTGVLAGTDALLQTTFAEQSTRIVALYLGGEPVDSLSEQEEGEVVLADDTDLAAVYRSSCIASRDDADNHPEWFRMRVDSAVQRGADAYVVGPVRGTVKKGTTLVVSPWTDPDLRLSKVLAVDPQPDGRLGLLLGHRDASELRPGDDVSYVEGAL